ncbi:MAG TPA: hypothetical protein VJ350_04090, partial [Methanoregula sp.]|nr:hypothetical protein [Methanoregula sp.]
WMADRFPDGLEHVICQDPCFVSASFFAGTRFFLSDEMVRGELEFSWGKDPFLGPHPLRFSDIARNGNRGSNRAYQIFGRVPVTGLNRGFLESCFRITDYPVRNAERRIMRG